MLDFTKEVLFALGVVTSKGALTGLALSFTNLSPLVMDGIVASVQAALFTYRMYNIIYFICSCLCAASFATGVGHAAAATAVFPGAMLGMGSAALAGALIAPISVIALLVSRVYIVEPIYLKVNEYITSPIVGKCFSSKEEENGLVKG